MRLLLDTHVLLWSLLDHACMPQRFRQALADPQAQIYVSAVSVWEATIKRRLGKLDVPAGFFASALAAGCIALPITWIHTLATYDLPLHHHDPFDRLLIAQARSEGLVLVTADRMFHRYDVDLLDRVRDR